MTIARRRAAVPMATFGLASMIAIAAISPPIDSVLAEEPTMKTSPNTSTAKAKASARASATTSSSSGSTGRTGECQAHSSATAEAISSGERKRDHDEKFVTKQGPDCAADASSRASASSGKSGDSSGKSSD